MSRRLNMNMIIHSDKNLVNKSIKLKPQAQAQAKASAPPVNGFYSMNAIVKSPKTGCNKCGH